jgi:hypothetical protein
MQKLFICKTIRNLEGNTNYGDSEIEENIGNFANGVYFIKIKVMRQDGKEDTVVKKFVVVK